MIALRAAARRLARLYREQCEASYDTRRGDPDRDFAYEDPDGHAAVVAVERALEGADAPADELLVVTTIERAASGLFANLGGEVEPPEELLSADGIAWHDLTQDQRGWWCQLVRDVVCLEGKPHLQEALALTHLAGLIREPPTERRRRTRSRP